MSDSPEDHNTKELRGWGRATVSTAHVHKPVGTPTAQAALSHALAPPDNRGVVARGLGRSYGDAALNAGGAVLITTGLDDIGPISASGQVRLAAGVSIHDLLLACVPQGWFVPVSPGTRQVTIGGAIAADIHGKNHHVDGTFGQHVTELDLLLPSGDILTCGPNLDPDAFWCTVGGMGLTGIVLAATVQLSPIPSSKLLVDTQRLANLDALLHALRDGDHQYPYSVAWVDLLATGKSLGRAVLTQGRFAPANQCGQDNPLAYGDARAIAAPAVAPGGLLNLATIRAFNTAWYFKAPKDKRDELQSIGWFFHPLDGVTNWNRIYGPRGFLQWQIVVPDAATDCLVDVVQQLSNNRVPTFLAVLKRFGPQNPGPLSFPTAGWTLTADIPVGSGQLGPFLDALDRQVVEAGGRVYLAKDSRMSPTLLSDMYPRLEQWRDTQHRLDPHGQMVSDLDRRLGLVRR